MPRVIVSGSGVAGTVLAYWLGKNGFQVVVVERSSSDNQSGQIVDVDGPSQEIMTRMGVMDEIQSRVTHEAGIRFVDDSNRESATFPAGKTGIWKEIEIMGPALAGVSSGPQTAFQMSNFAMVAQFRVYSRLIQRSSSTSKRK